MREIKFRAWDTFDKKFLFPWPEGFYIFGETTCFDLVCQQLSKREGIPSLLRMNDVEIQQYTGLKDKNGKEIYEGDILSLDAGNVHVVSGGDNDPTKRIVAWREDEADWFIKQTDGEWQVGGYCFCKSNALKLFSVVGNIYENPELLK